jgi:hypothetical protein
MYAELLQVCAEQERVNKQLSNRGLATRALRQNLDDLAFEQPGDQQESRQGVKYSSDNDYADSYPY